MQETQARHDAPVQRPVPDQALMAVAQRYMMDCEDEVGPAVRFARQRWENALGAVHVAMQELRDIYPTERHSFTREGYEDLGTALGLITSAYRVLDGLSEEMLGSVMHDVISGHITTMEELEEEIRCRTLR